MDSVKKTKAEGNLTHDRCMCVCVCVCVCVRERERESARARARLCERESCGNLRGDLEQSVGAANYAERKEEEPFTF
jgi:hypothetical protein